MSFDFKYNLILAKDLELSIQVMIDVLRQASKACVVKREFSKVSFRGGWKLASFWMIILTMRNDEE